MLLGIWEIDPSVEKMEAQDESVDIDALFKELQGTYNRAIDDVPNAKVRFHPSQWRLIEQARNDEEQLRNELATDRILAQTFRDVFLLYNKPWLKSQLHEVFTPRTLFLHRKDIIDQFLYVMGDLAPDISLSDQASAIE